MSIEKTDDELVKDYLSGETKAFDELFNRYRAKLYPYILSLCLNKDEAEDIFQETFIRMVDKLPYYKPQNKFSAWLFLMARNIFLDNRKNKKEKFYRESMSLDASREGEEETFKEESFASVGDPQSEMVKKEKEELIISAMNELSNQQREIISLRHFAGLSFKEISQELGIPIGTALASFSRGLEKMRERIKRLQ